MIDDWTNVGKHVEARRTDLGYTQEAFVSHVTELVGRNVISTSTLRLIENARQERYRSITLRSLVRGLQWIPDAIERLLDGEQPDETWTVRETRDPVVQRDYNSDVGELPPEDQAIIDNMIDSLRRKQQS